MQEAEITDQPAAMRFLARRLNVEVAAQATLDVAKVFSLSRIRALLARLGDPHLACPVVHVAGSKGKGSVCEMIASGLAASGFAVGLYTSPHLQRVNERIRVNHSEIEPDQFAAAVRAVASAAAQIEAEDDQFTHFELVTAAAFLHFALTAVDVAVIEVGLGGRHDATNVVSPRVCAITAIQLEHTQILGDTLEQIAHAKAGIIKDGVPVLTIPQTPEVHAAFAREAAARHARLQVVGSETIDYSHRYFIPEAGVGRATRAMRVTVKGEGFAWDSVRVPFAGEHQAWNCGLALATLGTLASTGMSIDLAKAAEGVSATPVRGRLEWMKVGTGGSERRIGIDGAHTPDSVAALLRTVASTSSHESMIVVVGAAADKDLDGILRAVAGGADKAFFCRATNHRRAADHLDLLRRYEALGGGMAQATAELEACLDAALRSSTSRDVIIVTGSFTVAGEAREIVESRSVRG